MDAFAVSVTNGMCYRMHPLKIAFYSGTAFGVFQGLMPLIGYAAGHAFRGVMEAVDHWIALILLVLIGGKMIVEAVRERRNPEIYPVERVFSLKTLIVQSVATSIDALAVGVSLGVIQARLLSAVGIIALITFCCCFAGALIGRSVGGVLKGKAEILGGILLILIGLKILGEHLNLF